MYMKEDVVGFVSELKIEMDELERIIDEGKEKHAKDSDPEMQAFIASLEEISTSIFYANAIIGVILKSYLSSDMSAMASIDEEIEKLTEFEKVIDKVKHPITMVFSIQ